jgi:hypothetical protein
VRSLHVHPPAGRASSPRTGLDTRCHPKAIVPVEECAEVVPEGRPVIERGYESDVAKDATPAAIAKVLETDPPAS